MVHIISISVVCTQSTTFIDLNGNGGMFVKISFEGLLGWNGLVPSLRDSVQQVQRQRSSKVKYKGVMRHLFLQFFNGYLLVLYDANDAKFIDSIADGNLVIFICLVWPANSIYPTSDYQ